MINLTREGVFVKNGRSVVTDAPISKRNAADETMAARILAAHDCGGSAFNTQTGLETACAQSPYVPGDARRQARLKFDALASHDITYVGVIQTVRAAVPDFDKFPVPYVLTNCHNSLCAVGGTTNADDHAFGLSAAKKYGGIFVPPHIAVIHQYVREEIAAGGRMVLGSDSHTRYGALGCMGIGEGGGELVKQILGRTYDIARPEVVGVMLTGTPQPGVGPQDVALALIGAVFADGFVKNKVLEFFGPGVAGLSVDFRMGVDVMTTETTCLSSIWETDGKVEEFYDIHGRAGDFAKIAPGEIAYYDGLIEIDLDKIVPMIAMPVHPSNVYKIEDIANDVPPIDQGIIAGCAGGLFESVCGAAEILRGRGTAFPLAVYPASQPMYLTLMERGVTAALMREGAILKTAFCGPCFGAGDVPKNDGFSIRHVTRNFPNREGAKPAMGQNASVALMDALSIAATAANGGKLTAATNFVKNIDVPKYYFDGGVYEKQIYKGAGKPDATAELVYGPGIRDWPPFKPLAENILLQVASLITDDVTTTDELIPSGETSTFRSNPYALAEHTLSRKDPSYVARAKASQERAHFADVIKVLESNTAFNVEQLAVGSVVYARKPGDGSAREQAASCQRVLGGLANIAQEYATKRYRSNLINWGMLPFIFGEDVDNLPFSCEDFIYIPNIRAAVQDCANGGVGASDAASTGGGVGATGSSASSGNGGVKVPAFVVTANGAVKEILLELPLSVTEAEAILAGCLINLYSTK